MAALCKVPTKSADIGLSITAICKNAEKKTLGQDDFFVVVLYNFQQGVLVVHLNSVPLTSKRSST